MRDRARVVLALILGVAVLAAFTLAFAAAPKAPDKDITIDAKDVFTKMKKSPVVFPHTPHKDLKCTDCHHTYKEGDANIKKCSQCHKLETKDKTLGLEKAYHDKCVTCHKKLKKAKKKTGPTACSKCHPKKKK